MQSKVKEVRHSSTLPSTNPKPRLSEEAIEVFCHSSSFSSEEVSRETEMRFAIPYSGSVYKKQKEVRGKSLSILFLPLTSILL
ncbi:hypothetical protein FXW07_17630 [Methanosarcina sp. DH1]|uniref:hypothetical protein n=1 Tax=Methanosarcina sp. DH1 TaxID=2605695 RepID=UPI001E2B09B4|nr:hypothetical protein [Methanosarcina sp. DH1]MCC4768368.1 hypothetical protein [Methanosarcina sp. DH1]